MIVYSACSGGPEEVIVVEEPQCPAVLGHDNTDYFSFELNETIDYAYQYLDLAWTGADSINGQISWKIMSSDCVDGNKVRAYVVEERVTAVRYFRPVRLNAVYGRVGEIDTTRTLQITVTDSSLMHPYWPESINRYWEPGKDTLFFAGTPPCIVTCRSDYPWQGGMVVVKDIGITRRWYSAHYSAGGDDRENIYIIR